MISDFLKSIIVCPICKGELNDSGLLDCVHCKSLYQVENGVPILLRKELTEPTLETTDPHIKKKQYEAKLFSTISNEYKDTLKIAWDPQTPYSQKVQHILEEALTKQPKNSAVLDIGGNSRGYIQQFGFKDSSVVMDISASWLTSLVSNKIIPYAVAGDCEELPFKSESFDLILMSGVLHHVPRQKLALQEIGRVLNPGGKLVMIEPAKWSVAFIYYILKRSVFILSGGWGLQKFLGYYGSPYESFVSPKTVKNVFDSSQYEVKIEKSTPLRLPYISGVGGKEGTRDLYFKLLNALEGTFLTDRFGSYIFITIQKS